MKIKLLGTHFIDLPETRDSRWSSHMMAPAPYIGADGICYVYFGAWDANNISSIFRMKYDLEAFQASEYEFQIEKGLAGTFDENGVFPGAAFEFEGMSYLSYTGFQLGHKIPHYNFAGLCRINIGGELARTRDYPILDRTSEGLFVRSGLTYSNLNGTDFSFYAAGSSFEMIAGKMRPNYDIFMQKKSPFNLEPSGQQIIERNADEHGLGRPYVCQFKGKLMLFYTRRKKDFNYRVGMALSDDQGNNWKRSDYLLDGITSLLPGIDDEMQYFPAPLIFKDDLFIFYNGNNFGRHGIGVAKFQFI